MNETPIRQLLLETTRRASFLAVAALFVAASALAAVPILRQPGFELATLLGVLLAFLGGLPALAAIQAARKLETTTPFARLAALVLGLGLALPLPALLVTTLASLLTTPCNPLSGLPFCLVILPTASVLSGAVGLLAALASRRRRGFWGYYLLAVLASAVVTAYPVIAGPQVFAFNLFAGYFPGPIYDESIHITPGLLWARLETLLWTAAALGLAASSYRREGVRLGKASGRSRWAALGALVAIAVLRADASALGLRTTTKDLDDVLGGLRITAHFRIHYPREHTGREVEQLARDLEYRYHQDSTFLGAESPVLIDAYFYRSPQEKQRWVGAAETDFAKPWLHQFHLQYEGFPDRVAKHELAHVLAGEFGCGPFKVAAVGGLLPIPGIIEGLATAADSPVDELTLPEWAHAMRALHLAPDLRKLLGPTGFYGASSARAYTLAGAFLRYLIEKEGREKLHVLYCRGDFQAAYGRPLDSLVREWEQANDATPYDEHARTVAERRFSQPSLFGRTCAREEARLREKLDETPVTDLAGATELTRRLVELDPHEVGRFRELASRQREAGDLAGAQKTLTELLAREGLTRAQRAEAELLAGDLEAQQGQLEQAGSRFQRVIALHPDDANLRAAEIRLASLAAPTTIPRVLTYFRSPRRDDALLGLRELIDAQPAFSPARYLVGRRLTDAQLASHALEYLDAETLRGLDALPGTLVEAVRLRARSHMLTHDCAGIRADAALVPAPSLALRAQLEEWLDRCNFEEAQRWPALPPPS